MWGAAPGKELFQTKVKIHKRLFALLMVFALVIGLLPSVLADNEPSTAESTAETLEESPQEESPAIAPPTQSILESDEAVEGSPAETDDEAEMPTSMDGETLTRMDNGGVMLLGGGGTMGKSTCVTFAAYQSARWKCHRYEVDGSHSYGHYFYTSEIAYHTIDGVDSYCIEPNTTSLGGQYYTSYTADEASSSSYWKLELDDLQRSHIQKILAFGYPQVDYGYSRQVQYAATQVLIWEVVSHSRYNADMPFTGGPYYAVQGHLNHDGAFGGVLIDLETRAYRPDGSIIDNLFVPGDFASGRFINSGNVKEQVINDLGWAVSSGYTAGHAAVDFLNH